MRYTQKTLDGKCKYVNEFIKPLGYHVVNHGAYNGVMLYGPKGCEKTIAFGTARDCVYQLESFMDCFFMMQRASSKED